MFHRQLDGGSRNHAEIDHIDTYRHEAGARRLLGQREGAAHDGDPHAGGDELRYWNDRVLPVFALSVIGRPDFALPSLNTDEVDELEDSESVLAAMVDLSEREQAEAQRQLTENERRRMQEARGEGIGQWVPRLEDDRYLRGKGGCRGSDKYIGGNMEGACFYVEPR